MSDDFQSHERLTATKLNRALRAGRCIGRARRITDSTATSGTARTGVLELDDIPLVAGRLYHIVTTEWAIDTSVAADVGKVEMLYTTDGSTPTITSTQLPGAQCETVIPSASRAEYVRMSTSYVPSADETLSLLAVASRTSGTGVIVILGTGTTSVTEFRVIDLGEDPGDTGVDV